MNLRPCTPQHDVNHCGVATILAGYHVVLGKNPPESTDFNMWRRLLATFLSVFLPESNKDTSIVDGIRAAHIRIFTFDSYLVRNRVPTADVALQMPILDKMRTNQLRI
jgi:hypothetical protein